MAIELPFRIAVIGGSDLGRSNLIASMLKKPPLYKVFRRVFLVNPILAEANDQIYRDINDDVLKQIMNDQFLPSLLIIDNYGELANNNEFAKKLCIRSRHSKMSCIFSVQNITMIPPSIRQSLTHLCMMSNSNQKQTQDIIDEYFPVSRREANEIVKWGFEPDEIDEKPFLFLDMTKGRFFKRFPTLNMEW